MGNRVGPETLQQMKAKKERIAMLTCYDYPTALCLEMAQIDVAFIGDSVGTNVLGYSSSREVTMADMVHHTKAVKRGIKSALVLSDMPYESYRLPDEAIGNALKLVEAGVEMVKLEGGAETSEVVVALRNKELAVMGHIGHTPQSATGKRAVVGATAEEAVKLWRDARALEKAGVNAIVLECVPEKVAKVITEGLRVPTIGIGSGRFCDGQVLVVTDLLGWHDMDLRFTRKAVSFSKTSVDCFRQYIADVKDGVFPKEENTFRIKDEAFAEFTRSIHAE